MIRLTWVAVIALCCAWSLPVRAAQAGAAERVAAIKQHLQASQAALRKYEWVETTTVTHKGEEKSRKQARCYYGEDGKIQKIPLGETAEEPKKRGLRGRITERVKEKLEDYMEEAVALVHQYVPPDQTRIQGAKEADKVTLQPLEGGKSVHVTFADYLKVGDSLAFDLDLKNSAPLAVNVKSYLDSQKEPVLLTVSFGAFENGIIYTKESVLEAKGKSLVVTVQNSGYRPTRP